MHNTQIQRIKDLLTLKKIVTLEEIKSYLNPHCSFFCKIIKKSVDNSCFYQQLQSAENVLLRLSAITL